MALAPIVRTNCAIPEKLLTVLPTEALTALPPSYLIVQVGGIWKALLAAYLAGNRAAAHSVSGEDADSNIFIAHLIWSSACAF